ncbi:MAG: ATPase [Parabacteroides sp.]|nr:ATPase [Parabacteroides sp.]
MGVLIADGGSTKTAWVLVQAGRIVFRADTGGINPYFQSEEEIRRELTVCLLPLLGGAPCPVERVYFYGAGCAFPDKIALLQEVLGCCLGVPAEAGSDLLGAARGLCGREPGIACILGTGSNSCMYNGESIVQSVSPLGFILGDEGSGAFLGKRLVADCLKNRLPPGIKERFLERFGLTPAAILEGVYRLPFPNRFLAGLSVFLGENREVPELRALLLDSFRLFFTRNVQQYAYGEFPAHFTGSVAWHYRELVALAAADCGIRTGRFMQSPLEGLAAFHKG